jgi:hypothetical protein
MAERISSARSELTSSAMSDAVCTARGSVTRTYSGGAAQVGAAPGPPPAAGSEVGERSRLLHLATVIGPDVGIVAVLAVAVSVTLASTGVVTDAIGVALVASVTLLVYVVGIRLAFASTAGEPLSGTSYSQVLPALE